MTLKEFRQAVKLAQSREEIIADDDILFGCGLSSFKPVCGTIQVAAKFIRWQAMQLNGQFDSDALEECHKILKTKFIVV